MKKSQKTIAALFSFLLPIVGCVGGYWYGNQINWLPLGLPPEEPAKIAGVGQEHPESEINAFVQTVNGDLYYYRHGAAAPGWVEFDTQENTVQWLEGSGLCDATARSFIPPPPGDVMECIEYAGYYAAQEPEVYVKQWVLLEDGNVWEWSYPRSLVYAIVRRNILFGFLGLLAGGLVGIGIFFASRDKKE